MAVLAFVGLAALGWIGLIVWWVLIPYLKREGDWT